MINHSSPICNSWSILELWNLFQWKDVASFFPLSTALHCPWLLSLIQTAFINTVKKEASYSENCSSPAPGNIKVMLVNSVKSTKWSTRSPFLPTPRCLEKMGCIVEISYSYIRRCVLLSSVSVDGLTAGGKAAIRDLWFSSYSFHSCTWIQEVACLIS